ncbi:inactive phospholipase C-like protein 2 isoform X6 [Lynx rufus]|uniref:inactive phospholipase C-like protein 2 isoform X6 n=1 Tax=Lynx rufus TaxID=61384 RepID=UPI001F12818E|nr:inactive phospholipase C-like protein 2 isoform X6 [Lynx rufus]
MAECGRGGAAGGALPTSPGPALGAKGALKAGAGEGGGGGGGGSSGGGGGGRLGHGRARYDSGGVSNGDCSLGVSGDEARASPARGPRGAALAPTPSPAACPLPRESKPGGLPRRSSIIKDGTKQKRERKKTVSFSSMPTEKKISSASDCINSMVEGSELKKVRSNSRIYHRVFPSPMRIDSSNMNPQDFWKCGCQIVAMNFQTPGLMMDLNIGWFRQNGNCGYVLRPAIMREEVSFFSANTKDSVPGVSPQLLHIKIISGQNFPKPKGSGAKGDVVDPYVYVEIHGIPADCAEQRTKTVHQNGDAPIFDESFEFQINLPELAMVRFVVLDDDYIGDEFIGQYTIPFECLQTGYRHVPLQSLTGEVLAHASLFVHVAITNRRGGGKPHKRGLSVRKGKKSREYASLRTLWIKTVDEVFKNAQPPIRDATDLRENMQNAVVSFKELCGLSSVANLMQCMLAVSPRFLGADNTPLVVLNLSEQYPTMELQGIVPEVLKKIVTTYDMMIQSLKAVIENADAVYEKIVHCQKAAMEFHEHLHSIGTKEGLKERKLQKAVESFTWNITILKGQADLLKYAKNETLENLKQIHYAAVSCGLNKPGTENADVQKPRRSLEVIPEKANDETGD